MEDFSGAGQVDLASSLITVSAENTAKVLLNKLSGFTQKLFKGQLIGQATEFEMLEVPSDSDLSGPDDNPGLEARVREVTVQPEDERRAKLAEMFAEVGPTLPPQETAKLHSVLLDNEKVFSVDEGERGETDLLDMCINTGGHPPKKQAPRRVPFAARHEIAQQLRLMQE